MATVEVLWCSFTIISRIIISLLIRIYTKDLDKTIAACMLAAVTAAEFDLIWVVCSSFRAAEICKF